MAVHLRVVGLGRETVCGGQRGCHFHGKLRVAQAGRGGEEDSGSLFPDGWC